MKTNKQKFLNFGNHSIFYLLEKGTWWLAAKPISEALGVDWKNQHRKIKGDPILSQVAELKLIYIDGDQGRSMLCLPEKFVYGWIFKMESSSPQLLQYQWKCYELLYDHFNGTLIERQQILEERSINKEEIKLLKGRIETTDDFRRLKELEKQQKSFTTRLNTLDKNLVAQQGDLFQQH